MKRLFSIFVIILFYSTNILPQVILDSLNEEKSKTLSRLKLSGGYNIGKYLEAGENSPFLNFNYRATQLNKYSKDFISDYLLKPA